jgi:hypothetical protein
MLIPTQKTLAGIKGLLSLLILACIFLPLTQCTIKESVTPPAHDLIPTGKIQFIPSEYIRFEDAGEIILVLYFLWPSLAVLAHGSVTNRKISVALNTSEAAISGYCIYHFATLFLFWHDIRYGGYILLFSYSAYLLCSAYVVFLLLNKKDRHST